MTEERSLSQIEKERKRAQGPQTEAARKAQAAAAMWEGRFVAERRRADRVARGLRAAQADNQIMRGQITEALLILEKITAPTIGTSMSRHLDRVLALVTATRERLTDGWKP